MPSSIRTESQDRGSNPDCRKSERRYQRLSRRPRNVGEIAEVFKSIYTWRVSKKTKLKQLLGLHQVSNPVGVTRNPIPEPLGHLKGLDKHRENWNDLIANGSFT